MAPPAYVPLNPGQHVRTRPGDVLEFNPQAVDISLLDRRGKVLWRQLRNKETEPILWEGLDQTGRKVPSGHYVLRILYPLLQPVYVPFIVM